MQFIGYVVFLQGIYMEDEQIKTVHDLFKLNLEQNIQIFLEFANFYYCLI